jgi:pentatricopeptide repeat protein
MNNFLTVLSLHLLDPALAFFGRLLRMILGMDLVTFGNLLKCLYDARRTHEATNGLLHRMPEFACVPNIVMCSRLLKCFCDGRRSEWALELLRLMAKEEQTPHRCCQIHHGH